MGMTGSKRGRMMTCNPDSTDCALEEMRAVLLAAATLSGLVGALVLAVAACVPESG
jgi:hypothetical protein